MPPVSPAAVTDAPPAGVPTVDRPPRVLIVTNSERFFLSHRLPIARGLLRAGCEVWVAAGVERQLQEQITAEGLRFIELGLDRGSRNPARELATIRELAAVYRRVRPDVVHHVTVKPILYGSFAARLARVPHVVNAVPGLGYLFIGRRVHERARARAAVLAYRLACRGAHVRFIFQNPEDRALFLERGIAPRAQTVLIRGSGVDLRQFAPSPPPPGPPVVLLPARLLWDKGLAELVEAARRLRAEGVSFRLVLAGETDPSNPRSADEDSIRRWQSEGLLEWWGHRADMPDVLRQTSIVALPSYREGLPKALLEAGAAGLPSVTADVPGCREVVQHEVNGLLVPPRDARALAAALRRLLQDAPLRAALGARARQVVVEHFSEQRVVHDTLALYRTLLEPRWPAFFDKAG